MDGLKTAIDLNSVALAAHLSDVTDAHADTAIDNTSNIAGANVQEALNAVLVALQNNTTNIGTNTTNIGTNATNISNNTIAIAAIPIKGVIQITNEAGIIWTGVTLGAESSQYSSDFAVGGAKVGDVVLVTPINRPTGTNDSNQCSFEGVIASAGNIKVNAVNHDETVVSISDLNNINFNVTILSFT